MISFFGTLVPNQIIPFCFAFFSSFFLHFWLLDPSISTTSLPPTHWSLDDRNTGDSYRHTSTPVVALAKHNSALAVRIKVIFYLSLLATSLEVWPSKVEEPREQMWAPSPCQKQKTPTALNPASRKQQPVQWLRGRQQEKHFAALVNISLCTPLQLTAEQWCHLAFLLWKENECCQAIFTRHLQCSHVPLNIKKNVS